MVLLFFAIQLYQKMRAFAICNRPHFSLFGVVILLQPLFLAAGLGFEPRQTESESAVLPLHNPAIKNGASNGT